MTLQTSNEKKALRETQTLHAGCSKAEPIIFAPPQTPFLGGAGRPKFNQLEMVTTFTVHEGLKIISWPSDRAQHFEPTSHLVEENG